MMRFGRGSIGAILGIAAVCAVPALASAETTEVNTTADENGAGADCSLREAITTANNNAVFGGCVRAPALGTDRITFAAAIAGGASIDLATVGTQLEITTDDLNIVGPGLDELIVTNSNSTARILAITDPVEVEISGLNIEDGDLTGPGFLRGGGIYNDGGLLLTEVRVASNEINAADSDAVIAEGGGIYNGGVLTLDHSIVEENDATATESGVGGAFAHGGGIFGGGTLELNHSTVDDNAAIATESIGADNASVQGGGISAGSLDSEHSTISRNDAAAGSAGSGAATVVGGGISTSSGIIELTTVAENTTDATTAGTAQELGGGIHTVHLSMTSSTVAANGPLNGSEGGANVTATNNDAALRNTILANPRGPMSGNCDDPEDSFGFNLDFAPQPDTCDFSTATDLLGDPLLGALADNGGPTETILPVPGNGAGIDKGSSVDPGDPTHDQRGVSRPQNFASVANAAGGDGSDIGAVEVPIAPPLFTSTVPASPNDDDTPTVLGTSQPASNVQLYTDPACTVQTGPTVAFNDFATSGITVDPVPSNAITTFYGTSETGYGTSECSSGPFPNTISYLQGMLPVAQTPPTPTPPTTGPTGRRAAALKKCKQKKSKAARKKCKKRANRLPV